MEGRKKKMRYATQRSPPPHPARHPWTAATAQATSLRPGASGAQQSAVFIAQTAIPTKSSTTSRETLNSILFISVPRADLSTFRLPQKPVHS